jgi:signal peptidase II
MQHHIGKYVLPGLLIILVVLLADQYSKWVMLEAVARIKGPASDNFSTWLFTIKHVDLLTPERERFTYKIITPFLNLVMVWNQGISFGLFNNNAPGAALAFTALSLIIAMLMFLWLTISTQKFLSVALSLIIGGALGNALDRVRFAAVEDFIDFHWEGYHWPAFNIADTCIVIGAFLLMIHSFAGKKKA